jgi:hypothetical protein
VRQKSIEIYLRGRLRADIEINMGKRARLYKTGGILPITFATHIPWYSLKKRWLDKQYFEDFLHCDIGVPIRQLEQQLAKQLKAN